jgi:hypothetical protein
MPLTINSTDINAISEVIDEVSMSVVSAYNEAAAVNCHFHTLSPEQIAESLDHFIEILLLVEVDKVNATVLRDVPREYDNTLLMNDIRRLDTGEISEIGNHGLNLLQTLSDWACALHLPEVQHRIQFVMVAVALWLARQGGQIQQLDAVVTTLTSLGNTASEPEFFIELSNVMGELMNAVSEDIRFNSLDRPETKYWRALNISRGIIATRSLNVDVMEKVFGQLVNNLPDDAAAFFEEGLSQLDRLDYPAHIKDVMVKYFHQYATPVLH